VDLVLGGLGAVAPGLLLGESSAAGPSDQHGDEVAHRTVIEAAVLAVYRPLYLVGGYVWELSGEPRGDLTDSVFFGWCMP
jgi:hypothetical protein